MSIKYRKINDQLITKIYEITFKHNKNKAIFPSSEEQLRTVPRPVTFRVVQTLVLTQLT